MNVTLTIDEALLREAERATDIHDWPTLVNKGLQALSQQSGQSSVAATPAFDFDRALAAAAALPDLSEAEFARLQREMNGPLPPAWSRCD